MTIELTEKPTDAERLHLALRCAGLVGAMLHDEPEYTQAAAEFAAPYLARITELESRLPANSCTNAEREQYERTIDLQNARIAELGAKHKSSCEVAAEFLCATELLATKMGTVEQNDRWRAAKESLLVVIRGEQ